MNKKRTVAVLTALIMVAVGAVTFNACKKASINQNDNVTDNLEQIQKRANFIGECHNYTLDKLVCYAETQFEKDDTINFDYMRDQIIYYIADRAAKFCEIELDSSVIYSIQDVVQSSEELRDLYLTNQNHFVNCADLIENAETLSENEKVLAKKLLEICAIHDYHEFYAALISFEQQAIDSEIQSDNVFGMIALVKYSSIYWNSYMTSNNISRSWFGFWENVGMGDFEGFLAGIVGGAFTCPFNYSIVFGPGGIVYCVAGSALSNAIFGSVINAIKYFDIFS